MHDREDVMYTDERIAIIGGGNLGTALAKGLVRSRKYSFEQITISDRSETRLEELEKDGFQIEKDNCQAVRAVQAVILAVHLDQADSVLCEISKSLRPQRHILISTVARAPIAHIKAQLGKNIAIFRAVPNIAASVGESMTCLCSAEENPQEAISIAKGIFDAVGKTTFMREEQLAWADPLCCCGIAFFLRAIRAASQGGVQAGFHAQETIQLVAQTAKGAATLLLDNGTHPEMEIDKVTTPRGITIAGLNEMEHNGFSSAMIRGIVMSAEKAATLYTKNEE